MYGFKNKYLSGNKDLITCGHAVAFTDSSYPKGKEIPEHPLIIEEHVAGDINELASALIDYAQQLVASRPRLAADEAKENAREAFQNLKLDLEGENNMKIEPQRRITRQHLETLEDELVRLTNDQFTILDDLQDPDNFAVIIDGAAGTGKTVLAMELARQSCKSGETVALLCSNPILSKRFERWAETLNTSKRGRVVPGTPATLPFNALKDFGKNGELQKKIRHLLNELPKELIQESPKSGALGGEWESFVDETVNVLKKAEVKFDRLIVDETQNLCHEVFLKLMDTLLQDKLAHGRWSMFGDFTNQNIALPHLGEDCLNVFRTRKLRYHKSKLTTNCRNTYEIAAAIATYVFVRSLPMSGVHGPLVQIEYFNSDKALGNLLDRKIQNLKDKDIESRQIILLANDKRDFGSRRDYSGWSLRNIRAGRGTAMPHKKETALSVSGDSSPKTLRYSDIYDFQGLESNVVILVIPTTKNLTVVAEGVALPEVDHLMRVLYTGMSRAKAMLIIVAHEAWKTHFERIPGIDITYEDQISEIGEEARQRDSS